MRPLTFIKNLSKTKPETLIENTSKSKGLQVESVLFANTGNKTTKADLYLEDADNTERGFIIRNVEITPGTTAVLVNKTHPIYLKSGSKLKARSKLQLDVSISVIN